MEMLMIAEKVLFGLAAVAGAYLFVFALFSLAGKPKRYPPARRRRRTVVLVPAYREDAVVGACVDSLLRQDYPKEDYDIVVISDRMTEETDRKLAALPVRLLRPRFEESSKAKALRYAMERLEGENYEIAVVLDADNTVEPGFLRDINAAFDFGLKAVQTHRTAGNRNTDTAVLDAVSEEINNSVFRRGHIALGFSAALSGSGMAFDYGWFRRNVPCLRSAGEDKELELLLLGQRVFVDYLDDTRVYDEKVQEEKVFYGQRRRWLAAQFGSLGAGLRGLPRAILTVNFDYCDKVLQWMMPPRILLLGGTGLMAAVMTLADWTASLKWWGLLLAILFALAFAVPDELVDARFKRALRKAPLLGLMMAANLFRLRGVNRKFIHTAHGPNA